MNNNIIISSLAMDLKRVALAFYNGSTKTAERFVDESRKRVDEVDINTVEPYLLYYLNSTHKILNKSDKLHLAETALMYSQIFQNYSISFTK